ncbi:MAG: hypothetical protein JWP07_1703 [Pseudonocardiales bacterium]|nr:hypothetical protein [Pseudonocardiales bacterium]
MPRLARSAKRGPIKAWQLPKTDDFVLTAVGGDYWRLNGLVTCWRAAATRVNALSDSRQHGAAGATTIGA